MPAAATVEVKEWHVVRVGLHALKSIFLPLVQSLEQGTWMYKYLSYKHVSDALQNEYDIMKVASVSALKQ